MPISAPNPNSPPSVNRVEAFTITAAESTPAVKAAIAAAESATIASVCPVLHRAMWSSAAGRSSTTRTAMSIDRYSVAQSSSVAGSTRSRAAWAAASPWSVTPASARDASRRGRNGTSRCTSKVSAELQTLTRWILELSTTASAVAGSAEAST
jgi:hypothetical protein